MAAEPSGAPDAPTVRYLPNLGARAWPPSSPPRPVVRLLIAAAAIGLGAPLAAAGPEGATSDEREPAGDEAEDSSGSRFSPIVHRSLVRERWHGGSLRGPNGEPAAGRYRLAASASAPLLTGDVVLVGSVGYRFDRFTGAVGPGIETPLHLHGFNLGFPLVVRLRPDWSLSFSARVSYSGSLDGHHARAWQGIARAGATWSFRDDMALLFGVVIVPIGFTYVPVPSLAWLYRPPDGNVRVDLWPPRQLEVRWRANAHLALFAGLQWRASEWQVGDATRFEVMTLRARVGSRLRLAGPLELETAIGLVPWRRHAVKNTDTGREVHRFGEPGLLFSVSLGLAATP